MENVTAEQILMQEIARGQQSNGAAEPEEQATELSTYNALRAEFPKEAYSQDSSRGFALTSVKAQYVVERLNEVLGLMNWSHGGNYEKQEDGSVLYHGGLVININGRTNRFFSIGYSPKKRNMGDAYKSAKTDSLCKCASQIGVANDAFKGLIDPNTFEKINKGTTTTKAATTTKKAPTPKKAAPASGFSRKSSTSTKVSATAKRSL